MGTLFDFSKVLIRFLQFHCKNVLQLLRANVAADVQ